MVCGTDEENLAVYTAAVPTNKTCPAVFTNTVLVELIFRRKVVS